MTEQCFRKCVPLFKEPNLSVGEATCVDRCVHKYMAAHGKVQEILGKQAQAAQQQAGISEFCLWPTALVRVPSRITGACERATQPLQQSHTVTQP
eukprot:scaffold81235_cov74-Phaeocystis_antarctica.AAC.2